MITLNSLYKSSKAENQQPSLDIKHSGSIGIYETD